MTSKQDFVDDEAFEDEGPELNADEQDVKDEQEAEVVDEGAEGGSSEPDERDWESEATTLGWHSNGPKDAKTFIEDGEKYKLGLKRKNETQQRDFEERMNRMERMHEVSLQRQREQAEARYNAQQEEAVSVGDLETYRSVTEQKETHLKQYDAQPAQPQQQQIQPEVIAWQARHKFEAWSGADQKYAADVMQDLMDANPNASNADLLPALDERLKRRLPDLMGVSQRRQPRQLTDQGGRRGSGKRSKGVAELPSEARRAAKMLIEDGTYKDEAEYAADYWGQEG